MGNSVGMLIRFVIALILIHLVQGLTVAGVIGAAVASMCLNIYHQWDDSK